MAWFLDRLLESAGAGAGDGANREAKKPGMRRAVYELTNRFEGFDYFAHLRGTTRQKDWEWDLLPAKLAVMTAVHKQFYPVAYSNASADSKEIKYDWNVFPAQPKDTPKYVNENSPVQIFYTAAYSNTQAICEEIRARCAAIHVRCNCSSFNVFVHEKNFGLSWELSSADQMAGHDWGFAPAWTGLLNLFAARWVRRQIFTLCYSRYGQMLHIVSGKFVSGHTEQKEVCVPYMWEF